MRGWKRTITLKELLGPDRDGAAVRACARVMSDRLKHQGPYVQDGLDEFSEIVDEMFAIAESTPADYTAEDWTILNHFNLVMSALYDWADAERVWIA